MSETAWIYGVGTGLLAITGFLYWNHFTPEWQGYQEEFRDVVARRLGPEKAATIQGGIQQIWVPALGRTDRCVTCHMGVDWKGLDNVPQPFRSHPAEVLKNHPLSRYGCTVCHGGQGFATDMANAHAVDIEHWEEPLLGKDLARAYSVSERNMLLQTNCNVCHRNDRETQGADAINEAKRIVQQKGCRACHTINGRGGSIGPDLTEIGGNSPEQYDYSRMSGKPSVFGWHVGHFKNPKSMSPETVMPAFGFGTREAQSLALLVMSWKKTNLPVEYLPGAQTADLPTPEERAKEERMLTGEGAFFVRKGCFICHDVTSLGIESAAKIGPDLSIAVTDVQSRFGRTLEDFLREPTGTMSLVLATQIHLTDAERAEAVEKLKVAYARKQEQDAKGGGPAGLPHQ